MTGRISPYGRVLAARTACAALIAVLLSLPGRGQYYDQGAAPGSVRWDYLKTPFNKVIFPSDYSSQAVRVMHYLDTVRHSVGYGYRFGTMRTPVVLQAYNFASNGLVMFAPTRMELMTPPPAAGTPEPWLKQLVTHESRHTVQYNNMNRHVIKGISYLLGDQGKLIGVALFPLWALEGDAVLAETELSTFGRGLQPSFTLEYRAMVGDKREKYTLDKWFCGSFKDFMPDHYRIGYQITSYAYTRYGENIWDRVADYATRYPYAIFTTKISLWKNYRTSANRLARAALEDMDNYWRSLPRVENSGSLIATPVTSYTTYSSPLYAGGRIVAFKSDLDRSYRIVSVDPATGDEHVVAYTGYPNSPLSYDGHNTLVWSELRNSKFWLQKVNSQICCAFLSTGKKGVVPGERQALFPSVYRGRLLYVRYDYDGSYSICEHGRAEPLRRFPLPVSIHGLAADSLTRSLYFIAVDEGGMYIGAMDEDGGVRTVRAASFATINDLRADGGTLYFTSTQSGRDEAHCLDARTGREWRLSSSEYGSFSPSPGSDGQVVMTTYTPDGYMLAVQPDSVRSASPWSLMPENVVNPPRKHWDIPLNMDSITASDTTALEKRRYRKAAHLINIHSWMPFYFEPEKLMEEQNVSSVKAGVTLLSQNVLSTSFLELRYAFTEPRSLFGAKFKYNGFAPKIEVDLDVGGGDRPVYNLPRGVQAPASKPYVGVDTWVYLPLVLSDGAYRRLLYPSVQFNYYNGLIYESDGSVSHGVHKFTGALQYTDNARLAPRDFLPRLGYTVMGTMSFEPLNDRFSKLWTAYARGYLPGVASHHSIMLRGAFQQQRSGAGSYHFNQKLLFPTGADYTGITPGRYYACAADYQLPVAYPDGGITSIIYFKRIRLNLAGYYARYRPISDGKLQPWRETSSIGADLILDVNILRTPASGTNYLRFSLYRPSDSRTLYFGFDFSLPI